MHSHRPYLYFCVCGWGGGVGKGDLPRACRFSPTPQSAEAFYSSCGPAVTWETVLRRQPAPALTVAFLEWFSGFCDPEVGDGWPQFSQDVLWGSYTQHWYKN